MAKALPDKPYNILCYLVFPDPLEEMSLLFSRNMPCGRFSPKWLRKKTVSSEKTQAFAKGTEKMALQ